MSPLIYALLAIVGIGAAGFALVPSLLGSSRADKRKKALQGDIQASRRQSSEDRSRDTRRKQVQQTLRAQSQALEKRKRVPLSTQIFQAGMKVSIGAFIRNSIIVGVVVSLILWVLQVPVLFIPVFGIAAAYLLPKLYMRGRRKRYQAKFLDELPNAVEAIVRGVKSGLPLNDSMRVVAKEVKAPVGPEFQRVLDQQAMGKSMTEAVQILYDRVPLAELNFFVVVITVQQQAGGNLSEALTNLARVLRNRKKMKAKVKAMSSEAKASAGIVGFLPFGVAGLVSMTSPTYLLPLINTPIGNLWLGIAVGLMTTGVLIMRKMVQIDF